MDCRQEVLVSIGNRRVKYNGYCELSLEYGDLARWFYCVSYIIMLSTVRFE